MTSKKSITEENLKVTEAMLARSFTNMKSSLTRIPGDMIKPVTGTVKAHPYASLAAAAGIGLIAYELLKLTTPRIVTREVKVQSQVNVKEPAMSSLISRIMAFAAPYVVSYLQQEVTRILVRPHNDEEIN